MADEYCNYISAHPDDMDGLAVILTMMLNCIHMCIHHKGGQWHTHVKTCPCACSLHMASMEDYTFIALQCIPQKKTRAMAASTTQPPPTKDKIAEVSGNNSAMMTMTALPVKPQMAAVNAEKDDNKNKHDLLHWVHCEPYKYPPSKSEKFKNCIFRSEAQMKKQAASPSPAKLANRTGPPILERV